MSDEKTVKRYQLKEDVTDPVNIENLPFTELEHAQADAFRDKDQAAGFLRDARAKRIKAEVARAVANNQPDPYISIIRKGTVVEAVDGVDEGYAPPAGFPKPHESRVVKLEFRVRQGQFEKFLGPPEATTP
jgi:hypothetical protein